MSTHFRKAGASLFVAGVAAMALAVPEDATEHYGFWIGDINISPYIQAGYTRDDNTSLARRQKLDVMDAYYIKHDTSDGYFVRPGFNLTLPGLDWRMAGNAYLDSVRYSGKNTQDSDNWGETLGLSGETDGGTGWSLNETVRLVDLEENEGNFSDPSYRYSTRDRTEANFGASLSRRLTERSSMDVRGHLNNTDYDNEMLYDYRSYGASIGYAHKLTERTDWTLGANHSETEQKDNSNAMSIDTKTKSSSISVGARSHRTEHLDFNVSGGASFHEGHKRADGKSRDNTTFTYTVGANWHGSERLSLRIYGAGRYDPAEDLDCNEIDSKSIGLTASYRLTRRLRLSAGAAYRREEYERKVSKVTAPNGNPYMTNDAGLKRKDDLYSLSATLSYSVTGFASVYVSYSYSETSSSISDFDFDRSRIRLGGMLRY